jgi:hypothetical protein
MAKDEDTNDVPVASECRATLESSIPAARTFSHCLGFNWWMRSTIVDVG